MIAALLFGILLILMTISVPIGVALVFAVVVVIHINGDMTFLTMVLPKMFTSVDSFSLLAIPCFIFAGNIMSEGGISRRLINVAKILLGRTPASLANITVGGSVFFGSICGSNAATVAAVGGLMIPEMIKDGYPKTSAAAIAASAGTVGVVIPPSVPMLVYAGVVSCSVSTLFMAGFVPGFLLAFALIVVNIIACRKYQTVAMKRPTLGEVASTIRDSALSLIMPVVVLGGIYGGVCTPTEAAAVACLYGFIISVFIYREIKLRDVFPIMLKSAVTASAILFVIGCSTPFQWVMTSTGAGQMLSSFIIETFSSKWAILMVVNVVLLVLGLFLETSAIILLVVPVLVPIAAKIGLDPIVLGLIVVVNTSIGMITPPLAFCLFVAGGIAKVSLETLSRAILPYLFAELAVLLLITYAPDATLFLPRLILGYTG